MHTAEWMDFNDADDAATPTTDPNVRRDDIRNRLVARIESALQMLLPAGKTRKGKFFVGDVLGSPGDSLEVILDGDKAGLWIDRATGDGGDVFALIAGHYHLDVQRDFGRVLDAAEDLVGRAPPMLPRKARKKEPVTDELGPATAKWDYLSADSELLACVYRYEPAGRRKEFRPWDAKRRKMSPPDPRPLYNLPGISGAERVVLAEGEKSAEALIELGLCGTTAMGGAAAPTEKTDWSPLAGKQVLIWPDRDKPGWEYALRAADAVLAAGATSCAVLMPPSDKSEGWDAADALIEGFDVAAFLDAGERVVMQPEANLTEPPQDGERAVWASEDFLALAFTRLYGYDWRFVSLWGKWLVWTGQRWHSEATLFALHLIRHVCREASHKADSPRLAGKLASSATVAGVERMARTDRRHAATAEEWDADPWLLNTPGGVVDLRSGRMREHSRDDRMTKIMTATPRGHCPTWKAFIAQVTGGDVERQAYLQRMAGYCLTGCTHEHALFFLFGTGANGKSVFINTLSALMGDYAANAPMDTFMETRSDRHPTDLAGLRGARLVSSIETEQGRRWAESKIKALTGGDKISARFMRQDFFDFIPQFKLLIAGNHKPAIRNLDEAMRRRLHLIPFTVTIPPEQRDKALSQKLLAERDGILAWMVDGCLAWQREGLRPPKSVLEATDEYFESEDALGHWMEARCQLHVSAKALISDLYADWRDWAERAGEYVGSVRRFTESLEARRFQRYRATGGARGFLGLNLQPRDAGSRYPYAED